MTETSIEALERDLSGKITAAETVAALEEVRVAALGKKGVVSERMKTLGKMSPEERKEMGPALNGLKDRIAAAIEAKKAVLEEAALNARLASEKVDVSLPIRPEPKGRIHPVSQVTEEIIAIFSAMGFDVAEGPERSGPSCFSCCPDTDRPDASDAPARPTSDRARSTPSPDRSRGPDRPPIWHWSPV